MLGQGSRSYTNSLKMSLFAESSGQVRTPILPLVSRYGADYGETLQAGERGLT